MLDGDVRDSNEESNQSQIDMRAGVVLPIRRSSKDRGGCSNVSSCCDDRVFRIERFYLHLRRCFYQAVFQNLVQIKNLEFGKKIARTEIGDLDQR